MIRWRGSDRFRRAVVRMRTLGLRQEQTTGRAVQTVLAEDLGAGQDEEEGDEADEAAQVDDGEDVRLTNLLHDGV